MDNLIIENTKRPVTTMLRNKLSLAMEQAEAHSEAVAKQERTLSTQRDTIDRLMKENAAFVGKYSSPPQQADVCPFCRRQTGQLINIREERATPRATLTFKKGYYQCSNPDCGMTYDKDVS